ncbi:MAG: thiamine diphosphokinase [Prevotella sp.]|nr:thiamine diphosphokinase [Prevotella sp.]
MIDIPFEFFNNVSNQSPLPSGGAGGWAAILANGEQPTHAVPVGLLKDASYVVCCDGAISHYDKADAVVGDGDSIPSWAKKKYECIFRQVDEQDDNDLTKATRFCLEKGYKRIVYLGATGLREDHTLGNISLIMRYVRDFDVEPMMVTNYGWFVPARGTTQFDSFPGQQVSIFNFGCRELKTEGLVYDGYPFSEWWQGTLNEASDHHFTIQADGPYLVYRTFSTDGKN